MEIRSSAAIGVWRRLLRLPIWLYRLHVGWVLGGRFLLLEHVGRISGRQRRAVLEVGDHDNPRDEYVIASAWRGTRADWFRNLQRTPRAGVQVGRRRFEATVRILSLDEATAALLAYARRHPWAFCELTGLVFREKLRPTGADCRCMAAAVPLVGLRPASWARAQEDPR